LTDCKNATDSFYLFPASQRFETLFILAATLQNGTQSKIVIKQYFRIYARISLAADVRLLYYGSIDRQRSITGGVIQMEDVEMKSITRCAAIIATAAITLAAGAAEARDHRGWWGGYGLPTPVYDGPVYYVQQPRYYAPPPVYGAPHGYGGPPMYGQPPVYQQIGPGVFSPYPQYPQHQGYYGRVTFKQCKERLRYDTESWDRDRQANGGVPLGPRPNQLRCADYPLN
jgi:hypothetical protein